MLLPIFDNLDVTETHQARADYAVVFDNNPSLSGIGTGSSSGWSILCNVPAVTGNPVSGTTTHARLVIFRRDNNDYPLDLLVDISDGAVIAAQGLLPQA